jgi:hypothetical protein
VEGDDGRQEARGRAAGPAGAARPLYYLHFKSIRKFIDAADLFDQWGTHLLWAYEVRSRNQGLRQRYERQLCLRSTALAKTLGPLVIRGLAVTGSDCYLREGSDVTVLFHVANRDLFLAAVNGFIEEARKEWGDRLKETRGEYRKVPIETFSTPLRTVNLHRATVGDFVIYSNSPAALRRVIDTHQGRRKALADAPDFRYMRTVFRADDRGEDGFAFLSDPFIRRLVGPASKIKEKRRLEALTSLHMMTSAALFAAWETGKLPASAKELYAAAALRPEEVYAPEGKGVTWDAEDKRAVSDAYGTLHFATPLVELPIDRVTETERDEYLRFRDEYTRLWRRYFDPVGVRLALDDKQVRIETYILPLIKSSEYNELREDTGGGTTPLELNGIPANTVAQFLAHIAPNAPWRNDLKDLLARADVLGRDQGVDWLGDWFLLRFDDSDLYAKIARHEIRWEFDPPGTGGADELFLQMPVTVGVGIKDPKAFADVLQALRKWLLARNNAYTWEPLKPDYKGVTITRVQEKDDNRKEQPALYYALVDGGWYVSFREECIKAIIDRAEARKAGKLPKPETVPVNTSLYVAPKAAEKTLDFAKLYLEWQTQRQALANAPLWYALYRTGLVPADAPADARRKAVLHYLGFEPVSAEGAPYAYEPKTDEVVNRRHGSLRRPRLHPAPADESPLVELLGQFRTVRADLRFREDGVNTVLTIERKRK